MTKFEVTLKQLRDNKACIDGYNKLVCHLKSINYVKQDGYKRLKHDAPIPLVTILEINGLEDALWCLRCNHEWGKPVRLLSLAFSRQVQHLAADKRSLNALDVAEKFANGLATKEELNAANAAASDAAMAAARAAAMAAAFEDSRAERAATMAVAFDDSWAARAAAMAAASAARAAAWDKQKELFILMCKNGV